MKTLNHMVKMKLHVNVRMSKIMRVPIKVGICMYVTYTNCRTPILIFGVSIQVKEQKQDLNDEKLYLLHSIYQEAYII